METVGAAIALQDIHVDDCRLGENMLDSDNVRNHPNAVSRKKSKYLRSRHKKAQTEPAVVEKQIVDDILGDIDLVDGTEEGQQRRADELRAQPIHLTLKRKIRKHLDRELGTLGSPSSALKKGTLGARLIRHKVNDVTSSFGLWNSHLKTIQGYFGTDVASYFVFLRWLFLANLSVGSTVVAFVIVPHMSTSPQSGVELTFKDILSGKGWFEKSGCLYGGYSNSTIGDSIGGSPPYSMPLAYLLTNLAYFVVFFLVIAVSLARSYRTNFIEGSGNLTFYYVQMILGGWDCGISNATTATMKKVHLLRELKEFLSTERMEHGATRNPCVLLLLRLGVVLVQFAVIGVAGWVVWMAMRTLMVSEFELVAIIAAMNIGLPFVFSVLARANLFQNEKNVVYSSLIMTVLLYGVTMGVLLLVKLTPSSRIACWESELGSYLYELVLLDFALVVCISILTTVIRRLLTAFCFDALGVPEFNISRNTVYLLYSQFICWLGVYYSPVLVLIATIKFFVFFYMNRVLVAVACVPSSRPWRAARMNTVFLMVLFVGFLFCFAVLGLSVWIKRPSGECGPFRNSTLNRALDIIPLSITRETYKGEQELLNIILSPGFVIGVIVILCVIVHYTRVVSQGKTKLVRLLREQIRLESKDRVFLQYLLESVQKKRLSNQPDTVTADTADGRPPSSSTSPPPPSAMTGRSGPRGRPFSKEMSSGHITSRGKPISGAPRAGAPRSVCR